jgi:hypothetical protein
VERMKEAVAPVLSGFDDRVRKRTGCFFCVSEMRGYPAQPRSFSVACDYGSSRPCGRWQQPAVHQYGQFAAGVKLVLICPVDQIAVVPLECADLDNRRAGHPDKTQREGDAVDVPLNRLCHRLAMFAVERMEPVHGDIHEVAVHHGMTGCSRYMRRALGDQRRRPEQEQEK